MNDPDKTNDDGQVNIDPTDADTGPEASAEDQMLVAYLDGELDSETTTQLELRLTRETDLRERLHQLQQTWDMLDSLPQTQANESFVQSTIEMMVTSAQDKRRKWHRWPLRLTMCAAGFVLTSILAIQVVRGIQNRPYREFVLDMDFIENIDYYDNVNNVEFLEQLKNEELFAEDLPRGP